MSSAATVIELLSHDRPMELVRRFEHGAGGTSLALLDEQPVVVKAWPTSPGRERSVTAGLRWAEIMRSRSVPIPRLLERGTVDSYSYLIYEFVDGEWPPVIDHDLAQQMLALVDRQRGAAGQSDRRWPARLAAMITDGDAILDITPQNLRGHRIGESILRDAQSALQACNPDHLRTNDVVHGDLAPENLLVHQGKITAVVDWEQACAGDAAFDLAGIVYDIELGRKADPATVSTLYAAIDARVPRDAWQLYTCVYAVRYASWAINTDMEADVLDTVRRIVGAAES